MKGIFKETLKISDLTGDLREDVYNFLVMNSCPKTAVHCIRVGDKAKRLAVGDDGTLAQIAGYLHDISAVYRNEDRLNIARQLKIDIFEEEQTFPMIIHQKISKSMAEDIFEIDNLEILNAIGCHTTLKANSTRIDQILFVADKIEWDQEGRPPYLDALLRELDTSLEHAAFEYIEYLWRQREKLRVIHPWLEEAYYDLKNKVSM